MKIVYGGGVIIMEHSKLFFLLTAFLPYNYVKAEVPQWETVMVETTKKIN